MNDVSVSLWLSINKQEYKSIYNTKPIYDKEKDEWIKSKRCIYNKKIDIPTSFLYLELKGKNLYKIIFHGQYLIDMGRNISLKKMIKEENCFYFSKNSNYLEMYIVGKVKPLIKQCSYLMDINMARKIFGIKFINNMGYNTVYKLDSYELISYFL